MKKVVFAIEVFIIFALFFSYLVLEISHETGKLPTTIFRPAMTVEKSKVPKKASASFKEQTTFPLPLIIVGAFIKIPS